MAKPVEGDFWGKETNARRKAENGKDDDDDDDDYDDDYDDDDDKRSIPNSPSALQLDADDSEDLKDAENKRLEQFLGMDNLRASFAFSKVIATKFEQFCKTHFRVDELLGRGVLSVRVERIFVD